METSFATFFDEINENVLEVKDHTENTKKYKTVEYC